MEIGDTRYVRIRFAKRRGEVNDLFAVASDLSAGMQDRLPAVAVDQDQAGIVVEGLGLAPLLEFNHDVGRPAGFGVLTSDDGIDPSTGERQLLLEEYFRLAKPGVHEIPSQRRDASSP